MKNLLFLFLIGVSTNLFSQNDAPTAVDDTLYFTYSQAHGSDSLKITSYKLLQNDFDVNNNNIYLDSIYYSGVNTLTIQRFNNQIIYFSFYFQPNYFGTETFYYEIKDNGSPIKRDTGVVTVIIMKPEFADLDANNIRATIHSDALFSEANHRSAGFEAPTGSGIYSIFSANLWVAGINNSTVFSNIRMLKFWYGYESNAGPVSNISHTDSLYNTKWDRVWKVKQYEIDYHLANWNTTNYNPPPIFLEWPAHGDTTNGEAYYLAPFFDYNNDGKYNPYDGDYPLIKGDQAIYFLYNDGNSPISKHPMISEIHGMAYAFNCPDSALQNSIFIDYRIINRSNRAYDSTYFGMWAEIDIGNPVDDYVQCDVNRSTFFCFNGKDNDLPFQIWEGYGTHPAAQATVILRGAKQDNDGQDNGFGISSGESINGTGFGDGVVDNEHWGMEHFLYYWSDPAAQGGPANETDYYYYLRSKWLDGTQMRYGGQGH